MQARFEDARPTTAFSFHSEDFLNLKWHELALVFYLVLRFEEKFILLWPISNLKTAKQLLLKGIGL